MYWCLAVMVMVMVMVMVTVMVMVVVTRVKFIARRRRGLLDFEITIMTVITDQTISEEHEKELGDWKWKWR